MKVVLGLMVFVVSAVQVPAIASNDTWPQWRGPAADGTVLKGNPPMQWGDNQNIRWKKEIPGLGLATPVIWGDQLFLLTAVSAGDDPAEGSDWMRKKEPDAVHSFQVMSLNRHSGEVLWTQTAITEKPHESTHGDGSWASLSPVTDGKVLVASFGSRGIFCYDLDGKLLWNKDLGDMRTRNGFGEGSSPVLANGMVIVNWDHEDQSFIVALDAKTGEKRWRKERDEPTSWSTPIVGEVDGKMQVMVSATNAIRGYDLETGEELWWCAGMTLNTIPTPIFRDGILYAASGFRGNNVMALNLRGAKGNLDGTPHVLWNLKENTPYVPSMVLVDKYLYMLKENRAILTCVDVSNGTVVFGPERLEGLSGVYASPLAVNDKVYLLGRDGAAMVLNSGPALEVLATNTLSDKFDASPAVVGDALYLRGRKYLFCVSAP